MSTEEKPKGIPLSVLLEPDGTVDSTLRKLKPDSNGNSSGVVMVLTKHRNLEAMMGQKRGDPKLRVALTKELLKLRDDAAAKAAKFPAGRAHGALDDRTKYIIELIQSNPGVGKPSGIWKLATDVERRGERKSFLKRAGEQLKK
jgi:hypothetical protein